MKIVFAVGSAIIPITIGTHIVGATSTVFAIYILVIGCALMLMAIGNSTMFK